MKLKEKEAEKLKLEKLYCQYDIVNICEQTGNRDWKNNSSVKKYVDRIVEIEKILNERG